MATTPARPGRPADNALSRRMFTVELYNGTSATGPAGATAAAAAAAPPPPSRQLKRIHLAAEILKARKICAGDAIVVMPRPEEDGSVAGHNDDDDAAAGSDETGSSLELNEQLNRLSLDHQSLPIKKRARFAVGVAWPSFTLPGTASDSVVAMTPLVLANSSLQPKDKALVATLADSGLTVREAERVTLIYDAQTISGRTAATPKKDSFFEAYVREVLMDLKYLAVNHLVQVTYNGLTRKLLVSAARAVSDDTDASVGGAKLNLAQTVFSLSRSTEIVLKPPVAALPTARRAAPSAGSLAMAASNSKEGGKLPGYDQIGGMEAQIEQIRELVEWPLTRPEVYSHFGLRPPRGVLLYGPPGTGKTLLAFSIAQSTGSALLTINGPSLSSAYHGETEQKLRDVFAEAKRRSPAVIVIDEVDALAPNREDSGEVERRVVATLLTLMDGLEDKGGDVKRSDEDEDRDDLDRDGQGQENPRVVVIAATNRPNAIDPALRRPGRFDKELEIGVPDVAARLSILRVLLRRTPHGSLDPTVLPSIAARTHGFVGADLSSLIHTAGLNAIKRSCSGSAPDSSSLVGAELTAPDLESALLATRPSAMREVFLETPKVAWSDIGGQEHVKARLRESVEWPLTQPEAFKRLGVRPPRGVLLYGPPGCSKTLIAKALASEGGLNFIAVKGPEIFNKYVGESEKAIREIFRKARAAAPSVVFLDEIDALAPARGSEESGGSTGDRVLMSLLTEMDGIEELNGVVVLAATNRPDVIDSALMRPGRLDRILYVSPPDLAARGDIFRLNFSKMAIADDVDVAELAEMTEGCSGAEIASICQDAALSAMNEDIEIAAVARRHLSEAARTVRRRITPEVVREYEEWRDRSGLRSA